MLHISDIVIGTVQFGMPYGLNQTLPTEKDTFRILDKAWELGIRRFDTAHGYGIAEERLGKWTRGRPGLSPRITTKFPHGDAAEVRSNILESFNLLGRDRVECLMAHDPKTLFLPSVLELLTGPEMKEKRLGASIYEATEAWHSAEVLGQNCDIQAPLSPYDTRIFESGFPGNNPGVRVLYRSIYLQGTIGLAPTELPSHLRALASAQATLHRAASEMELSAHAFAISFVHHVLGARALVLGIANESHLEAVLEGISAPMPPTEIVHALKASLAGLPTSLVDPRQWPRR